MHHLLKICDTLTEILWKWNINKISCNTYSRMVCGRKFVVSQTLLLFDIATIWTLMQYHWKFAACCFTPQHFRVVPKQWHLFRILANRQHDFFRAKTCKSYNKNVHIQLYRVHTYCVIRSAISAHNTRNIKLGGFRETQALFQ